MDRLGYFLVDGNYLENMNMKLLAGSFFVDKNGESNKNFIVINEQAVQKFQFDSDSGCHEPTSYFSTGFLTKNHHWCREGL